MQGALLLSTVKQRRSYLEAACGGDTARREQLLQLLELDDVAIEFFEAVEQRLEPDAKHIAALDTSEQRIGNYRIVKRLGSGGMGTVYHAVHQLSHRHVALKIPRQDVVANIEARKRLLKEGRTTSKLQHPGLVSVLEVGSVGPTVFIASELYLQGDLAAWLERHPQGSLEVVCEFLADLCDAVAYMHSCQIVHLDLKPSNIMLRSREPHSDATAASEAGSKEHERSLADFSPVITDFGISRILDERITKTSTSIVLGTPLYMAPEQMLPSIGCIGQASDLFAIGAIFAELLGIGSLREGKSYPEILSQFERNEFEPCPSGVEGYPLAVQAILSRCLATAPEHRYESAVQLAADLRACAAGNPIGAKPVTRLEHLVRWCCDLKREQEAWWIVATLNLVMFFWMAVGICLIFGASFPGASRTQAILASLGLLFVNTFPMMGLAVLGLRGKSWALTPALYLVVFGVVLTSVLVLAGVIDAVPGLYENSPFFKYLNHALVLAFGSAQALALLVVRFGRRQRNFRVNRTPERMQSITVKT